MIPDRRRCSMAATAWDLFQDPEVLEEARKELERRREGHPYQSLLAPGQKPPLNYRSKPR